VLKPACPKPPLQAPPQVFDSLHHEVGGLYLPEINWLWASGAQRDSGRATIATCTNAAERRFKVNIGLNMRN
jgi:hypothetical protein